MPGAHEFRLSRGASARAGDAADATMLALRRSPMFTSRREFRGDMAFTIYAPRAHLSATQRRMADYMPISHCLRLFSLMR